MSMTATYPAVLSVADGDRKGLLEGDGEVDRLLRALAGSLTAVLTYLSHAAHHPETALDDAVERERTRLGLTRREAQVLMLLARGFTNREIAAEFVISARTAEHHVSHVLRKLGASNRREAAAIARRLGGPNGADSTRRYTPASALGIPGPPVVLR